MAKKRNVFDIDFDLEGDAPARAPETKSRNIQGHPLQNEAAPETRRGPMASAIAETADASQARAQAEAAIRAENDALAHEHVRLKKLGLVTDLIPTADVRMEKLTRDRSANADPELEELKASIASVGLSNPIRVEQTEDGYELIQGYRRLTAFRELEAETGQGIYAKIPAALVPRGEPLADLYRKMVDENLVRKDISFGEMAQLAISYAQDMDMSAEAAAGDLYASALKQKRRYIRQFAQMLEATAGAIRHVEALPRSLGLELHRIIEAAPERAGELITLLDTVPKRDAETEMGLLKAFVAKKPEPQAAPKSSRAKTSLRLARPEGEARVLATDGRVELRLERDFSQVPRAKLQGAIEAFLAELDMAD
ncbi:MAG: ParB N-terminal domain-containing protein [Pseudomonadota bacterium]